MGSEMCIRDSVGPAGRPRPRPVRPRGADPAARPQPLAPPRRSRPAGARVSGRRRRRPRQVGLRGYTSRDREELAAREGARARALARAPLGAAVPSRRETKRDDRLVRPNPRPPRPRGGRSKARRGRYAPARRARPLPLAAARAPPRAPRAARARRVPRVGHARPRAHAPGARHGGRAGGAQSASRPPQGVQHHHAPGGGGAPGAASGPTIQERLAEAGDAVKRRWTEIATRFQRNGSAGAGGATVERGSVGLQDSRDPDRYDRAEASARAKGCLLYTSPSPRDGLLSRMPSSA